MKPYNQFHLLFLLAMIDQKGYPTAKWKAKSRLNLGWIIG